MEPPARPAIQLTRCIPAFIGFTESATITRQGLHAGRDPVQEVLQSPTRLDNWLQFVNTFGGFINASHLAYAVYGYFANGGGPCYVYSLQTIAEPDLISSERSVNGRSSGPQLKATYQQAFADLADLAEIGLLLCPDLMVQDDGSPERQAEVIAVQQMLVNHCQDTGRFAILHTPPGLNAQEMVEWRRLTGINSSSAALYYPWIFVKAWRGTSTRRLIPPSGHIAGIYYRIQKRYGRSKAPGGEPIRSTLPPTAPFPIDPEFDVTEGERHVLYPLGINTIHTFPGEDAQVWGARTLNSEFILIEAEQTDEPSYGPLPAIKQTQTAVTAFIGITGAAGYNNLDPDTSLLNQPILVTDWEQYRQRFGGLIPGAYLPDAVYGYFANGGGPCYILSLLTLSEGADNTSSAPSADVSDQSLWTALNALEPLADIRLLVYPDLFTHYDGSQQAQLRVRALQSALIAHCEMMSDRITLLDTPPHLSPPELRDWRLTFSYDSSFAAMYYPWIKAARPDGSARWIPPCGHIAGIINRSDQRHGIHKPPANEIIHGALSLETKLLDREQNLLAGLGINCLRAIPNQGIRIWGACTLSRHGTDRYLHVRRVVNMVKLSVAHGTRWACFEQHTPHLWQQFERNIQDFLDSLRRQGILQGENAAESYFVQCDHDVNTVDKQRLGIVEALVHIAVTEPFVFNTIGIRQTDSPLVGTMFELASYDQ